MGMVAGDKLPVVKPGAVTQEKLDVGCDQRAAMFVDGMFQLVPNFGKTIQHDLPFFFRQMQGLIYIIRKKRIILYMFAQ